MTRNLSILNLLSVLLVIIVNYYSQTVEINNNTIGSLSKEYDNLFTPAPYAFAIWGVIFFSLLVYVVFQINRAFSDKDSDFVLQTGPWFFIANFANAAWVVAWLFEYTLISVFCMFVILASLIMIILRTNMERWDAPLKIIAFTWWPICLYSGWIALATIANVAAYLAKIGWNGWIFNEFVWTLIMIMVAVGINLLMVYKRNMREFGAVGIWGLFAIYMRHSEKHPEIAIAALAGSIVLLAYIGYHGYKNRKTNPMYKLVNGQKL
ncbi:MAG: tryptophan-rich sensory protein [Gillisia sp.]